MRTYMGVATIKNKRTLQEKKNFLLNCYNSSIIFLMVKGLLLFNGNFLSEKLCEQI